jgi:hypothetical protein
LGVLAFKSRGSALRHTLKVFKENFDNPAVLKQHEPLVKLAIHMSANPLDLAWRGESYHQLALLHDTNGENITAKHYYIRSLETFSEHEVLGLCRAMRDYALFLSRTEDAGLGLKYAEQALALHDDDLRNTKGLRQRRITESYVWRARLLVNSEDSKALRALIEFGLDECRDCSLRDQQHVITFVVPYTTGLQRQLLDARLVEINARRRNVSGALKSMAKLVIDAELMIAGRIIRFIFRKE